MIAEFDQKGYPSLRVYDDHFEVKARDYHIYRSFSYRELEKIELIDPKHNFWYRHHTNWTFFGRLFGKYEPLNLRITKKDGGIREYSVHYKHNQAFRAVYAEILSRLRESKNN